MAWRAAAAIVLLAAAALRPSSAWAGAEGSPPIVAYRSDQLSVRAEKVPLETVLAELRRLSGASILGAPREPRDITAQFDDVPLPEALQRLLGDQNFILTYGDGDRLRTIELFGGPHEPRNALAVAISILERHPPVAVTGPLAQAFGGNTATFHQLLDAALHQPDAVLRTEALRVSLNAFDAEPELFSSVLRVLSGVDDATLGQMLRGVAGVRAEELANQVAAQARTSELRSRALSVLQRLRTIGPPGG